MAGLRLGLSGLVAVLGAGGCRPPDDVEPSACRNPEPGAATLGTGDMEAGFVPLEAGDPLMISFGPQGMHMVVVSIRVTDIETARAGGSAGRVEVALRQDDVVVGGTSAQIAPSEVDGDVVDYLGLRAIFTVAEIEEVGDRSATLEGTVVDGCDRVLAASTDVWLTL